MSLRKIARNTNGDDVLAQFGSLANRIVSDDWLVYAQQAQFERLIRGEAEGGALDTFALLRPPAFDGFREVVVASACVRETMFYRVFAAQGADLQPAPARLGRQLRYDQHAHGERIMIYYAGEEAWSKRFRDKLIENAASGRPTKLINEVKRCVLALFGPDPFLWMGNNDLADDFFGIAGAERLPNTPHGLNSYQGTHNVVVLSALNPPPAHFHFLASHGISGDEVRTGHYRTAVYQAVMRCSIRNPDDAHPKHLVVMDRDTAEWLAHLFPGSRVEVLPGMGAVLRKGKAGRPRRHASSAERTRAYRENKRRELIEQLDLINEDSFAVGEYPLLDEDDREQMGEFLCDEISLKEGDYVTARMSTSSTSGTAFVTIYDRRPLAYVDLTDDDTFIASLRDLHGRVVAKEAAGLISPAHFVPTKAAGTARGLDNIAYVRGIWLDNDGGDLTPDAFAGLFPHLRVVVWNTASSTLEKPRWRAFIPTTCAMSVEVHRVIMAEIEAALEKAGFWGKKKLAKRKGIEDRRRHGFDESKFNAASLFYLPCQAKDPCGSFFHDYGEQDARRSPLDLHQWIEHCVASLRPAPEVGASGATAEMPAVLGTPPESKTENDVERTASRLDAIRRKLAEEHARSRAGRREERMAKAIEAWRSTPPGMGHQEFFRFAASLRGAGLDEDEVRAKLYEEAQFARSPRERRAEIRDILKSLRRSGRLR